MMPFLRGLLALLLVLGTAVGCSQAADEADSPTADSSPAAAETETESSPSEPDRELASTEAASEWQDFAGAGLTLSLPGNYIGGNPSTDLERLASELEAIDPQYAQRIESIRQNPEAIAFLAFDPASVESGFLTNVNVATEAVPADISIEQYLEAAAQQLTQLYEIESQEVTKVGDYEAGKIVGRFNTGELQIRQLFYAIKNGETFWIVTYATIASEFDRRLPDFERSIQTLQIEL